MKLIRRAPCPLWLSHFGEDPKCIKEIVGWLNDPVVTRYSEQRHKTHTFETQLHYIRNIPKDSMYWGLFIGNDLIGTITAYCDPNNRIANLGLMIGDKAYWGVGLGSIAWQRMGDFVLHQKGMRKVEAGCMAANLAMNVICQKYGMVEEGRQDRHFQLGDCTTDLVHWGKFNEAS